MRSRPGRAAARAPPARGGRDGRLRLRSPRDTILAGGTTGDNALPVALSEGSAKLFSVLTTNQKGTAAELAVALEAVKLGIGVYVPFGDERYDLIFDLRPRLVRVQCKWANRYDDVVIVRLYSARRARDGLRRRLYSPDEVDAFAAYCLENGCCYFFEMSEVVNRREVSLRLGPTRNNQAKGVKWARDFEFGARLGVLKGPIAQLGERGAGSAEVAGSSPAGSILVPQDAAAASSSTAGTSPQRSSSL